MKIDFFLLLEEDRKKIEYFLISPPQFKKKELYNKKNEVVYQF
jgi:hypothetical protein